MEGHRYDFTNNITETKNMHKHCCTTSIFACFYWL